MCLSMKFNRKTKNLNNYQEMQMVWVLLTLVLFLSCWISCREDRLLCLHVQQVNPGSPCLSAGQNCEWTNWAALSLWLRFSSSWFCLFVFFNKNWTYDLDFLFFSFLLHSLLRPFPLMLNVTNRRCLGMCWTRSSRPSPSADCVWQPQGAPRPLSATPSLAETQHNHVTKHCGWHFQYRPIY